MARDVVDFRPEYTSMFGCLLHLLDQVGRQAGDVAVFQRVVNVVQMTAQPVRPFD